MSQPYVGQIEAFAFNFAPRGWALCQGQLLSIQQNVALFSLLGTFFGGNGVSTFGLPDLRGRGGVSYGTALSGTAYTIGEAVGTENVTLLSTTVPPHTHPLNAVNNGTTNGTQTPSSSVQLGSGFNTVPAPGAATNIYGLATGAQVALETLNPMGGSTPHANLMPYLAINYCISLSGIFPSRN